MSAGNSEMAICNSGFFFGRCELSGEDGCVSFLCQHSEREGERERAKRFLSYLLMAFFKYCCSHLVSGLMQTSLLLFSLALWNKRVEFEELGIAF